MQLKKKLLYTQSDINSLVKSHEDELNGLIKEALANDKETRNKELIDVQKAAMNKTISEAMVIKNLKGEDIQYWEFKDINDMLSGRAFCAIDYFKELEMRCTKQYLQAHCDAVDNMINNGKRIEIGKLAELNMQLQERLDMLIDPDIVYKIASVVYFDKTEDPYGYDYQYNNDKIMSWKKAGLDSFFFLKRLGDLIPVTNISDSDLKQYLSIAPKVNQEHLRNISTMLSKERRTSESFLTHELLVNTVSEVED